MIYTCPVCGERFSEKQIKAALEKKDGAVITCYYCETPTEINEAKKSKTSQGYEDLAKGRFFDAGLSFKTAIKDARSHGKRPSPDTYIGWALADFRIQTVFSDEENGASYPKLICHQYQKMRLSSNRNYMTAVSIMEERRNEPTFKELEDRITFYAKYVDAILDEYEKLERENGKDFAYSTFIAYEDEAEEYGNRGYEIALEVQKNLPTRVRNAFLPDIEDYQGDRIRYEAAILYAIDHSNSMLVIADNDIDERLTETYTRFFEKSLNEGKMGLNLGFVLYCGQITISLPNDTVVKDNAFIYGEGKYYDFVQQNNNIFTKIGPETHSPETTPVDRPKITLPRNGRIDTTLTNKKLWYKLTGSKQIYFGHYPQPLETSNEVCKYFEQFPKPNKNENNGWHVLFKNSSGLPTTWYRDEVLDDSGVRYRAVIFNRFRDMYAIQKSDIGMRPQREHHYLPSRVYCFKFTPIVWDIEEINGDTAILVADQGIDSREYNNEALDNEWAHSYIKRWLNENFEMEAFSEEEREHMCSLGGESGEDKVFLMDKTEDKAYYSNINTVIGSDYYRCIGGMGNMSSISSCWITDMNEDHFGERRAAVVSVVLHSVSKEYVDNTTVAIVPKIYMKLR